MVTNYNILVTSTTTLNYWLCVFAWGKIMVCAVHPSKYCANRRRMVVADEVAVSKAEENSEEVKNGSVYIKCYHEQFITT
jgi:hypothetical protein